MEFSVLYFPKYFPPMCFQGGFTGIFKGKNQIRKWKNTDEKTVNQNKFLCGNIFITISLKYVSIEIFS